MTSPRLSFPPRSTPGLAAALLLLFAAAPGRLLAVDGNLDLSFGSGTGARTVSFNLPGGSLNDYCSGVVAAADGTLFAVGSSDSETFDLDWTIAKLTEGVAPLSRRIFFDLGGASGPRDDQAQAVALDRSGRLLVAGSADNTDRLELRICRLLPGDLSNDPTFNSGACVAYALNAQARFVASAVAEAPDSGLLIAGNVGLDYGSGWDVNWFVLKLTSAGVVDSTFGYLGLRIVPWDLVPQGWDRLAGMAVDDRDGSIALVGTAAAAQDVGALARLTATGNLDLGFGQQGKVSWAIPNGVDFYPTVGTAVIRDPITNQYWMSGYAALIPNSSNAPYLEHFDADGNPLGSTPYSWGDTADYPRGLLLQSDRKLVLPGDAAGGNYYRASRFLIGSGVLTPDATFGTSGDTILDPQATFGWAGAWVCAATLDAGRVVLLANVMRPDWDWLVVRLQNASIFVDGFEPGNSSQWSVLQP